MNIELKKEWFVHRTYTNGDTRLTIIWAKNNGNNISDWLYKKQIIELDRSAVETLENVNGGNF